MEDLESDMLDAFDTPNTPNTNTTSRRQENNFIGYNQEMKY